MICYIREKKYGVAIEIEKLPENFITILKEHLKKYNIVAFEPETIGEVKWSDKIPLDRKFKQVPTQFKSSGAYQVYFDNQIVYIGSSDCDGNIKGKRGGMWSRRADFKSTLIDEKRYKCASTDISNYFYDGKKIPKSDLNRIKHEFYPCHPDSARDVEFKLQKEYKDKHGELPLLNQVENFTGGARKIK